MKVSCNSNLKNQRYERLNELKQHGTAWLALLIVSMLYEALPKFFYWGPRGLMIGLVAVLIIPLIITHWRKSSRIYRLLNLSVNVLITVYMIMSVGRLVLAVLQSHIGPLHLLISALTLWATNVLVFALWYWNLDGGGPAQRGLKDNLNITAFLFPQMQITLASDSDLPDSIKKWKSNFIDYLFLSFNTSTAFSPTDTPVLNRWAKCMSMIQAMISLTIIIMLAARAINILTPSASYLISGLRIHSP